MAVPHDEPESAPTASTELRRLVAECLERCEREGETAIEDVCREHPEHAAGIRKRLRALRRAGLFDVGGDARGGIPERLGEFRLRERLGSGGMGVVYVAEQDGLGREVALKLVRPDRLFFPGARERFQREVEAVARLEHKGIVPVYAVGEEHGIPYLAMERVRGASLADVLAKLVGRDPSQLTGRDLLHVVESAGGTESAAESAPVFRGSWTKVCFRIVAEVADALEHAHQRGVLHRDVKPSNVMVTSDGRVRLLDFGLARAEGASALTRSGSELGSLPYMAPEQLRGEAEHVGSVTDVYGLGVTLYELLTLHAPYHADTTEKTRARILAGQPRPPSRWNTAVAWDAETVCLTAMDLDPERRYASAAAFAGDLRNYLDLRSITARRPGPWLRTRRAAQRRPALATGILAAVLVLSVGPTVFAVWQRAAAEDLRVALADATRQRERAEANVDNVMVAVGEMLEKAGDPKLENTPHLDEIRHGLLEDAGRLLHRLQSQEHDDPRIRRAMAGMLGQISHLHEAVGENEAAEKRLREGLAILEALRAEYPKVPDYRGDIAINRRFLGTLLLERGRHQEATAAWNESLRTLEGLSAEFPNERKYQRNLVETSKNVAMQLAFRGRMDAAEKLAARAVEVGTRLVSATPGVARNEFLLARALHVSGNVAAMAGRAFEETAPCFRKALAWLDRVLAANPKDAEAQREAAQAQINLGSLCVTNGKLAEAEHATRAAVGLLAELSKAFPKRPELLQKHASSLSALAAVVRLRERPQQAVPLLDKSLTILESLVAAYPQHTDYRVDLANAHGELALALLDLGRSSKAAPQFERAIELNVEILRSTPNNPTTLFNLGASRLQLAKLEHHDGHWAQARATAEKAAGCLRKALARVPGQALYRTVLGKCLLLLVRVATTQGRIDDALGFARQAVDEAGVGRAGLRSLSDTRALRRRPEWRKIVEAAGPRK